MTGWFSKLVRTAPIWFVLIVITLSTFLAASGSSSQSTDEVIVDWRDKVEPSLLGQIDTSTGIEYILLLSKQADLAAAKSFKNKDEKSRFVYAALSNLAAQTQAPVIDLLNQQEADFRSFWIANMIWVKGDADLIQSLASRADISYIYSNPYLQSNLPIQTGLSPQELTTNDEYQWNLELINAPDVWQFGYLGQDIVIGGQDTGYDWQHSALKPQYRGWDGAKVDHNFNWHDAIHEGPVACGPDAVEACDGHGHGTHTMGIMIGDDGADHRIGVAPKAKWIGCRNMTDQGVGTPATYAECYQWFVAPTDLSGQNPDPTRAPDVISNSWSCPAYEGCTEPDVLQIIVENVRSAGILTVHSAGNSGPGCSTIKNPAAIYEASFTVGATTVDDVIWNGSSRGPVIVDGSNRLKPDIAAPGVNVNSSWRNNTYVRLTGTSMASPHVAGVAALIMSANPFLRSNPEKIEQILTQSATPKLATVDCGSIGGDSIPNNTYGYGRVDAFNAYIRSVAYKLYFPTTFVSQKPS